MKNVILKKKRLWEFIIWLNNYNQNYWGGRQYTPSLWKQKAKVLFFLAKTVFFLGNLKQCKCMGLVLMKYQHTYFSTVYCIYENLFLVCLLSISFFFIVLYITY